jgi:rod shape-determining protein MreD
MNSRIGTYGAYAGLLLGLILLQISFGRLIAIGDVQPDFVLLGIIVIALRSGQLTATVAGFLAGLALDLYAGEVVGLGALAKTCAGFVAGYYFAADRTQVTIRRPKFVSITAIIAALHQTLYLLAHFQRPDAGVLLLLLRFGAGGTLYTAAFGAALMLILMRAGPRLKVAT